MNYLSHILALQKAVDLVGGQSQLARKISRLTGQHLSQAHIHTWLNRSKKGTPAEYCLPIETITKGKVPACATRPDIYPPKFYSGLTPVTHHSQLIPNSKQKVKKKITITNQIRKREAVVNA